MWGNDIVRSKKFYDAVFVAIGGQPGVEDARDRLVYAHKGGRFMVTKPIDGKPASAANGGTIGFTMSDAKQAEAWHKSGGAAHLAARAAVVNKVVGTNQA